MGFFGFFVKKIIKKYKNVGFTGGKSWGLVDGVVGNQVHGGGKLPGALLGSQEAPGGPKQGFWGGPRGLGPPRAPLQVAPIFPVWETRILTYLGPTSARPPWYSNVPKVPNVDKVPKKV